MRTIVKMKWDSMDTSTTPGPWHASVAFLSSHPWGECRSQSKNIRGCALSPNPNNLLKYKLGLVNIWDSVKGKRGHRDNIQSKKREYQDEGRAIDCKSEDRALYMSWQTSFFSPGQQLQVIAWLPASPSPEKQFWDPSIEFWVSKLSILCGVTWAGASGVVLDSLTEWVWVKTLSTM